MTTRILTWNVNGLRAAIRKGLQHWLDEIKPDVVMLQEIRETGPASGTMADDGWLACPLESRGTAGILGDMHLVQTTDRSS